MPKSERGSAATELVLITPLLMAIIGGFVFAGRIVLARQDADDAARNALEAAVTMPDYTGASTMAGITAFLTLASDGDLCSEGKVALDRTGFSPGGSANLQVSCEVPIPHVAFSGLPPSVLIASSRVGVIEPYREMQP